MSLGIQLKQGVILVLALMLSACAAGPQADPAPEETQTLDPNRFAGLVDVGDHELWAECSGSGSPTIVLEAGDESDHGEWANVWVRLTDETRVCSYDRLGLGKSDEVSGCRQLADFNADLEALLAELGERGPYILVGGSGGGYLAAGFAAAHPEDAAGIVLLDTFRAIDTTTAPAELLEQLKCDAPANVERRDYVEVEHSAWDDRGLIGDIPVTIITNDYGETANQDERDNVADQQGWFVLSPRARQVVVTSGHDIASNESELLVEEVLAVLADARAS
jgi:pimeloyl-ACP methyl ester carboxylesterase